MKTRPAVPAHRSAWLKHTVACGLALMLPWLGAVHAEDSRMGLTVSVPNGYAMVSVDDLRLSSTAGDVRWTRVWDGWEWKFNPHWESLSQSWKNLTGSQTADTTSSALTSSGTGSTGTALAAGSGSDGGCWVWVDEDWQPSTGTTVIGGIPESGPLLPERSTPFNRIMGEATGDYPQPVRVSVDYASLCGGAVYTSGVQELEGLRRMNELYLGEAGRYAFSNRAFLEKRAVQALPGVDAATLDASLASGSLALAPETNPKGYRWLDKSGDWIDYNTQGQVVAWGDRNDNTVWLVRDSAGTVRGVVDGNGRVLYTLHYTGALLTEVRDTPIAGHAQDLPARSVQYRYDSKNRLVEVTDVRGHSIQYAYDVGNHIVSITDPEGRIEQLAYNGDIVKSRTAPDGAVSDYEFSYDDVNKQFVSKVTGPVTAAGRRVEDYTHNRVGKLVRRITNGRIDEEVRYDTGARAELSTNARGYATRTTRNEFDQVIEVAHPDGAAQRRAYSAVHLGVAEEIDELGVKTQYQYDGKGNPIKRIEAAGTAEERVTEYQVNALGQTTQMTRKGRTEANGTVTPDAAWQIEYDSQGQMAKTTDPEGQVRRYAYDRAGNLASYTDPRGYTTSYQVDAAGNLTQVTDALARTRSYQYDRVGNLVQYTDARAKITQAAYDALNRNTQVTNPVGGIYRLQYNGQGLPITETDEDGRGAQAEFDNFLRLNKQIDGLGNVTEYTYTLPDGTDAGTLGALWEPTETKYPSFTQQLRYDARERPVSDTLLNPNSLGTEGLVSSTQYDKRGQPVSETDANGKTRTHAWDALGQLVETTDSLGNKTRAGYDARGNLIRITDANGHANQFEYDRNDRVVKETLPLGQTTRYAYDAAGNLQERLDPNGHKTVYTYDAANRLSEAKQYEAGTTLVRTTTYTWDDTDNLTAWSDTDQRRNQTASAAATYDDANRKTGETLTYPDGHTLSYGYAYSPAGKKTRLTWPDGSAIDYAYSQHGELESVTIPGEGSLSVNQFKWFEPAKLTLPGGTTQERTLDGLLSLENLKVKTPGQQTVLSIANTWGKVQELKTSSRSDAADGASSTANSSYSYDGETRLTQATTDFGGAYATDSETFTLDAVGNRIAHSRVSGAWTYDANNRLTQRGSGADATRYEYDEAGNLTRKTEPGNRITQYAYDTQNRLTEVRDGAGNPIARYGYDPLDRRLWKEQYRDRAGTPLAQALRTDFLYADEGLIAEASQAITLNPDGSVTASGTPALTTQYGPRPDAEFTTGMLFIKTKNSNGQDSYAYYHHDQIGTPVQATDQAGNVVWAASYNVFGQASITTPAATADKPTIQSNLRLPGQYEDTETGLHYNYRRYYDTETGRYISMDPIGLAGGGNVYRYVEADPVNLIDPTGECPWCVAYAACVASCMLEDAAVNALTGECNNFGNSAKNCAASCALGLGLGRLAGWAKKLWDRLPCSINSFAADTWVHVKPEGAVDQDAQLARTELLPIGKIQVGDEVLAFAEWKGTGLRAGVDERLSYEKVTDVFTSYKQQTLVHLTLDNGSSLSATDGHPFKTEEGWRDAILLKKGGKLLLKGESAADPEHMVTIHEVRTEQKILPVFNLEVANAHTYFVGVEGVLAHNHGNSKNCSKFQYLYEIFNKKTNQTQKYGVTGTPPNSKGDLPRPKSQLGPGEDYRIVDTANNRSDILQKEKAAVDTYRNANNGSRPPRNKRP